MLPRPDRHLPPAFGAVSLLLQPGLAAMFAWVLFGEALGPAQIAGVAVVLGGVLIAKQGALGTTHGIANSRHYQLGGLEYAAAKCSRGGFEVGCHGRSWPSG